MANKPDFGKPEDVMAFLNNEFGFCGCFEYEESIATLTKILEWHCEIDDRPPYKCLYQDVGIFYLLVGMIDKAGLSEHGSSIRHPWLTEYGKAFLKGLKAFTVKDLLYTKKEAYDGIYHCLWE